MVHMGMMIICDCSRRKEEGEAGRSLSLLLSAVLAHTQSAQDQADMTKIWKREEHHPRKTGRGREWSLQLCIFSFPEKFKDEGYDIY